MSELAFAARQNLIYTYVTLASNVPGTKVRRGEEYTQTSSRAPLTICNMVIDCNFKPVVTREVGGQLQIAASESSSFRIFHITGDTPSNLSDQLAKFGFAPEYTLHLLTSDGESRPVSGLELVVAAAARLEVIEFMVSMFFNRRDPVVMRHVLAANQASPFEIWRIPGRGRPSGAVMLVETEGTLGMYNLCVAPNRRGQGLGERILEFCLAQAHARGKKLTFQADHRVVSWYRERGAFEIGSVKTFTFPQKMR